MSLLLDALNKADEERKRGDGPPTIDSHHNEFNIETTRKIPTAVVILIVVALLATMLAVVYWLGKNTQDPVSTTTAEPTSAVSEVIKAEQHSTATKPVKVNDQPKHVKDTPSNPITDLEKIPEEESVATLYQQQVSNTLPVPMNKTVRVNNEPIAANPANTATQQTNSIKQFANLPEIQDLPNDILNNLPSLRYTEHNYNNNGGSIVINGVVKHVNEELAPGLVIDKILEDGIILHTGNYSFKMRALNTWVNM
jgi:general secretion pathway protein B